MKIWVIEQYMGHGKWVPLKTEESGEIAGSTNFYDAHQLKREIVDAFWDISYPEQLRNFRVRNYAPKAK